MKEIKLAPKAKLNIVTDMIALDLAKNMKKKFKTPYVFFDKHMNKDAITLAYEELSEILEIDMSKELEESRNEYDDISEKTKNILLSSSLIGVLSTPLTESWPFIVNFHHSLLSISAVIPIITFLLFLIFKSS